MDISKLSLQDAQQYDPLQPDSLWIRIKRTNSPGKDLGEIISIIRTKQTSNINANYYINFNRARGRSSIEFNNHFIQYFGDKKVGDYDIEYIAKHYDIEYIGKHNDKLSIGNPINKYYQKAKYTVSDVLNPFNDPYKQKDPYCDLMEPLTNDRGVIQT